MTPKVKNAMEWLEDELIRLWGGRCAEFEITCASCLAWRTRDDLVAYLEVEEE